MNQMDEVQKVKYPTKLRSTYGVNISFMAEWDIVKLKLALSNCFSRLGDVLSPGLKEAV